MKYQKICFLLIFLLSIQVFCAEKWAISRQELEKQGINYKAFFVAILSQKHKYVLAYSKLNVEEKAKGNVYGLHKFSLGEDGKITTETLKLPIFFFGGIALTDKGRSAIVVGNYGTKILKVNLKSMKFKIIYEYQKGVAGFKTNVFTISYKNKIYLDGFFYDEEQYSQGDFIVRLDIDKKNKSINFTKKIDLKELYRKVNGVPKVLNLYSGDIAYLAVPNFQEKQTYFHYYNKGKLQLIDKGLLMGAFAGAKSRVFYTILRDKETRNSYVKDVKTGKTWEVGKKNVPYTYPFISKDGKVILICTVDIKEQRMSVYAANSYGNYELETLLYDVSLGPFKLSDKGDYYLYYNNQGMEIAKIPFKNTKEKETK